MSELHAATGPVLGKLVREDPRLVWQHEAHSFTPWLLANAEHLAEALGIELELEAAEHRVGSFLLDLVGRDLSNGSVLIVENQLTETDHSHLGQILTYAAGTAASTIVWIATRFREEHRQALDWLNENTGEDTHFFGIELEVVRIGNSEPAPLFNVVAQPNEWQKVVRAATQSAQASGKGALYAAFWQTLLDRVHEQHPGWTRGTKTTTQNWIQMRSPLKTEGYISSSFAQQGRLRHELYIDSGDGERNLALFRALLEQRPALEAAYGRPLTFEELEGKRACRIAEYREGDVAETGRHDEFVEWFLDAGIRLRRALAAVSLPVTPDSA